MVVRNCIGYVYDGLCRCKSIEKKPKSGCGRPVRERQNAEKICFYTRLFLYLYQKKLPMPAKVSLIQFYMRRESPEADIAAAERMIADTLPIAPCILPETFAAGLVPERKYAEFRARFGMMRRAVSRYGCAVSGGRTALQQAYFVRPAASN